MKKIFLAVILCGLCQAGGFLEKLAKTYDKVLVNELKDPNPSKNNYQVAQNAILISCALRGDYLLIEKDKNDITKRDFLDYLKNSLSEAGLISMFMYLKEVEHMIWASLRGVIDDERAIYEHFEKCFVEKRNLGIPDEKLAVVAKNIDIAIMASDHQFDEIAKLAKDIYKRNFGF